MQLDMQLILRWLPLSLWHSLSTVLFLSPLKIDTILLFLSSICDQSDKNSDRTQLPRWFRLFRNEGPAWACRAIRES
jgi:hypothetical protein